jgi:hypothetical protein
MEEEEDEDDNSMDDNDAIQRLLLLLLLKLLRIQIANMHTRNEVPRMPPVLVIRRSSRDIMVQPKQPHSFFC